MVPSKKLSKKGFTSIIVGLIVIGIIGAIFSGDTTPKIEVNNLKGDRMRVSDEGYLLKFSNTNYTAGKSVKVFVNEKDNLFVTHKGDGKYESNLSLEEGENKIKIIVSRDEASSKSFKILYEPPTPEPLTKKVEPEVKKPEEPKTYTPQDDSIFEAEITCQQYAQRYFNVEDINISYDQSSIKRKNPDGSILIKVSIADSRGAFSQQKPLGIMECTTGSNGLQVSSFNTY